MPDSVQTHAAPNPQPQDAFRIPRFAGLPTFMRLPMVESPVGIDIGLVGVPFDGGTTNRAGARHGPREMRNASSLMRRVHHPSGVAPYDLARIADLGDSPVNPIDVLDSLRLITGFFGTLKAAGTIPVTAGGDHLISLPILRALAADGPVGMIHFDSHSDTNDRYFGDNRYTHGTPFRRAVEEGLLDPKRVVQIGIRGSLGTANDFDFARAAGFRIVFIEEFAERRPEEIMDEARAIVGDGPVYISFDVDGIDPSQTPGTGTPEIGGYTTAEAQRMVRKLAGLNIVGADVVEVSPPFDIGNMTSLVGATLMFELMCVIAGNMKR
ncbi:agmatinase [Azospirillum sp. RWY-5-1]|uniref:Agmatinase n=1 Tax=Azospirillum oleiclasticum TaxID=2735135 RepID=A0ABX2T6H6_9PROT|nr:agmatinase [Azospirillum oleiclasticum]NYZ12698.1 agmatinase [Azospirillum oleiclasticum]NYZ19858.1 agmatinase [Azospirillum oleiclasticum]